MLLREHMLDQGLDAAHLLAVSHDHEELVLCPVDCIQRDLRPIISFKRAKQVFAEIPDPVNLIQRR
jgi:hypothetical protein